MVHSKSQFRSCYDHFFHSESQFLFPFRSLPSLISPKFSDQYFTGSQYITLSMFTSWFEFVYYIFQDYRSNATAIPTSSSDSTSFAEHHSFHSQSFAKFHHVFSCPMCLYVLCSHSYWSVLALSPKSNAFNYCSFLTSMTSDVAKPFSWQSWLNWKVRNSHNPTAWLTLGLHPGTSTFHVQLAKSAGRFEWCQKTNNRWKTRSATVYASFIIISNYFSFCHMILFKRHFPLMFRSYKIYYLLDPW